VAHDELVSRSKGINGLARIRLAGEEGEKMRWREEAREGSRKRVGCKMVASLACGENLDAGRMSRLGRLESFSSSSSSKLNAEPFVKCFIHVWHETAKTYKLRSVSRYRGL
jgi:hypothetical protein